jgi:translation initiation factor 2 alpha subunit (eIF-2alpha)
MNLQEAMKKAEAVGTDDCPVKIKLVAPPLYVLTTHTHYKVCLWLLGVLLFISGNRFEIH